MKERAITNQTFLPVGNDFTRYNHMLRRADRETVPTVMRYLDGQGMDVYLGGDVTNGWLRWGKRDYRSVKMWAVARSEVDRIALVKDLVDIYVREDEESRVKSIGEMDFYVKHWWTEEEAGRHHSVRNDPFTLTPLRTQVERMLFIQPARILLEVASKARFDSDERD